MDESLLIVHVQEEEETPPLLKSQGHDTDLDKTLEKLELFLTLLGLNQSSVLRFVLSWILFLVLGILLPMIMLEVSNPQIKSFKFDILVSQALVAAVSLLCLSHNLRKYGIRKFLFVSGHIERFSNQYHHKIHVSGVQILISVMPCIIYIYISLDLLSVLFVYMKNIGI